MKLPRVSIIVPTLNEEQGIVSTLKQIQALGAHEVIVVDGGSSDRTVELATPLATTTMVVTGGLTDQLNRGAGVATGEIFLFHHADVCLSENALDVLRSALLRPEVAGGAFRLGFDSPRIIFRVIAMAASLRNRLGHGPFGDQALFTRREVFDQVGGFSAEAILEDLDLVKKIKHVGRFVILGSLARTSVRRWETDGILPTIWTHCRVSVLYFLGIGHRAKAVRYLLQSRRGLSRSGSRTGSGQTKKDSVESA